MATKQIEHRGRVTKATIKQSTICLAMMAHGEAPEMFERIAAELGNRISAFSAVVDTDDEATATAIEQTFAHLRGQVHRLSWIDDKYGVGHGDYAANRNRMLQLAREAECDYVLWLDPDDPLIGTIPDELTEAVYCVEVQAGGTSWVGEQLIRKDADVHWNGMLHEYLVKPEGTESALLPDCYLDRTTSGSSRTGRIENKAIPLLVKMVTENPDDGHAWFYLAQSFKDIGKKAEAVAAYNQRAHMGGDNEVVFWCLFNVAQLTGNPDDYLQAWNVRPSRVEPLHALAAFYNARGQYVVGRVFAQLGLGIKPTDDAKFVERWVESYGLVGEFAHAEFALGDKDKAIKAWEYCLTVDDLLPHHRTLFQHNIDEAHEPGSGSLTTTYDKAFINSPLGPMEGSISEQEMHFLSELVKHHGPMKVAETGFDCGRSAWALLEGNPECTVTSFALMEFGGEKIVKDIIDKHFPGRHSLVVGDSKDTVPLCDEDFDLVFIDGGHDYETAAADLKNFAKSGRMVMFDDIVEASWAEGCVRAWREATAEDGFVDEKLETRDGPHGWSTGIYR